MRAALLCSRVYREAALPPCPIRRDRLRPEPGHAVHGFFSSGGRSGRVLVARCPLRIFRLLLFDVGYFALASTCARRVWTSVLLRCNLLFGETDAGLFKFVPRRRLPHLYLHWDRGADSNPPSFALACLCISRTRRLGQCALKQSARFLGFARLQKAAYRAEFVSDVSRLPSRCRVDTITNLKSVQHGVCRLRQIVGTALRGRPSTRDQ